MLKFSCFSLNFDFKHLQYIRIGSIQRSLEHLFGHFWQCPEVFRKSLEIFGTGWNVLDSFDSEKGGRCNMHAKSFVLLLLSLPHLSSLCAGVVVMTNTTVARNVFISSWAKVHTCQPLECKNLETSRNLCIICKNVIFNIV